MKVLSIVLLISSISLFSQDQLPMDSITCLSSDESVTLKLAGDLNSMKDKFNSFTIINNETSEEFSENNLGYSDVLGFNNDLIESAIIDFKSNGVELGMIRIEADEIRVSGIPENISESSTQVFPISDCK